MRFHDVENAEVHERFTVNVALNVIFAGQRTDNRDHGFGERFTLFPIYEIIIGTLALCLWRHALSLAEKLSTELRL